MYATTQQTRRQGDREKSRLILVLLVLLSSCLPVSFSAAADWPQFLGPNRDSTSSETRLLAQWPAAGLKVVWEREVGEGFSGPVVAGARLILFHRLGDEEVIECLEARTGKTQWKTAYPTSYEDGFGKGNGPRATPLLAGNRVFTLGAEGRLQATSLEEGKPVWQRSLLKDYTVPPSFFGVGASPVLAGDKLLVNVGGRGAGIVAFSIDNGEEVWKATSNGASYASPRLVTIAGRDLAVFFTRQGVVLLEPDKGTVIYQKTWRARIEASVNAATPVVAGNLLFFSASYETGALVLRVSKDRIEEVWSGDDILSNHYNTSIHHNGFLYGFDGRQETMPRMRCVELATGKVRWTRNRSGCGSMILAGGRLILMTEKGELVLIEATPEAYRELSRFQALRHGPVRAQIALANGLLYGRDQRRLVCWDLRPQEE